MNDFESQQAMSPEESQQAWADYAAELSGYQPGDGHGDGYDGYQDDGRLEEYASRFQEPVAPDLDGIRIEREANELIREHPALDDPDVVQLVVEAAQQRAAELGVPDLWRSVRFIRQVFLAEGGKEGFQPNRSLVDEMLDVGARPSIFK